MLISLKTKILWHDGAPAHYSEVFRDFWNWKLPNLALESRTTNVGIKVSWYYTLRFFFDVILKMRFTAENKRHLRIWRLSWRTGRFDPNWNVSKSCSKILWKTVKYALKIVVNLSTTLRGIIITSTLYIVPFVVLTFVAIFTTFRPLYAPPFFRISL